VEVTGYMREKSLERDKKTKKNKQKTQCKVISFLPLSPSKKTQETRWWTVLFSPLKNLMGSF